MACLSLQYPPRAFWCTSIIIGPRQIISHPLICLPTHPTCRLCCARFCLDPLLFWTNGRMSVNLSGPLEEVPSNRNVTLFRQSLTYELTTLEKAQMLGCRQCINGMWLPPLVLRPSSRGGRIGIRVRWHLTLLRRGRRGRPSPKSMHGECTFVSPEFHPLPFPKRC